MRNSAAEQFDPYYKWLAIPANERPARHQPPDHYRLLGIPRFEDDREVIAIAADRQMAHVKTFAVGKYSRESQKLLDELAKAKLCLLNVTRKTAYDNALRGKNDRDRGEVPTESQFPTPPPATIPRAAPAPVVSPVQISSSALDARPIGRRRYRRRTPVWVWCMVALFLVVAGILLIKMKARHAEHVRRERITRPTAEPSRSNNPIAEPSGFERGPPPTHKDLQGLRLKARPHTPVPTPGTNTPQPIVDSNPINQGPRLIGLPPSVDLPPSTDGTLTTLCSIPAGTKLSLISIDNAIYLGGDDQVAWRMTDDDIPRPFAELHVDNGELHFRWHNDVLEAPEIAIRNSLLKLQLGEETHVLALREPLPGGDEISFDLTDNKFIIKSSPEFPPPTDAICFQLVGINLFPPHDIEGVNLDSMRVGDTCVLRYHGAQNAWTSISMKKTGKVVSIEFITMYELPSGREIAMSIKSGNAGRRTIDRELQAITAARQEIPRLQTARNEAQSKLTTARRRNNQLGAGQLQMLIDTLDAQINESNQLIVSEPGVRADHNEQMAVTKLAQQLDRLRNVPYRFYMVIDGHEVNLIRMGDSHSRTVPVR